LIGARNAWARCRFAHPTVLMRLIDTILLNIDFTSAPPFNVSCVSQGEH
jgi:hypothetical protein